MGNLKLAVNLFLSRLFRVMSIVMMVIAVGQMWQMDFVGLAISLLIAFFAVYMELDPLNKNEVVDSDD